MREVGPLPLLTQREEMALAKRIACHAGALREELLRIPFTARFLVERWSELRRANRVTATRSMLVTACCAILVAAGEAKRAALEWFLAGDPTLPARGPPGLTVLTNLDPKEVTWSRARGRSPLASVPRAGGSVSG